MGIYERKILREKVRKHTFDQEKNKIKKKKKTRFRPRKKGRFKKKERNPDLEHGIDQEESLKILLFFSHKFPPLTLHVLTFFRFDDA